MNLKRYTALFLLIVSVVILSAVNVMAQPGGGGDPLPCDPDDTTCPIDGGVWVLVTAVIAFAIWYVIKTKRSLHTV